MAGILIEPTDNNASADVVLPPVVTGVTGAIGMVFTWLAGAQGRKHVERLLHEARKTERQAHWLPGAVRYRSFWDLMNDEYRRFRGDW
ncbi:hypothetical protein [Streptomyces sp. NPDC001070]